jgi:menaquinone-specific isochorismate synthase
VITPVLEVRTEPISDPGDLLLHAAPGDPLVFLRGADGLVGQGEALRLTFVGRHRVAEAAAAWRALSAAAVVDDRVGVPGTGLVAFGSLAFADESAVESVLIVPSVIIGRRDGLSWMTRVATTAPVAPTPTPLGPPWSVALAPGAMTPERYHDAVAAAVTALEHHDLEKVVLARDLVGAVPPGVDRRRPLDSLHTAYPDTFTFAVAGLFGASPETLVRSSRGQLSARVLAGSARPGATGLLESVKNRDEHDFAVRSVLDGLRPHTTALGASEPFVLALPNLTHLATDVTGTLSDASSALDLVGALHPTAAVAGIPTAAALTLIAEAEAFDRGRYAGPVGWIDGNGDGEWAIALRCAQLTDERVTAYAGAGIVAASDPATELAETDLKFAPIRAALS